MSITWGMKWLLGILIQWWNSTAQSNVLVSAEICLSVCKDRPESQLAINPSLASDWEDKNVHILPSGGYYWLLTFE